MVDKVICYIVQYCKKNQKRRTEEYAENYL